MTEGKMLSTGGRRGVLLVLGALIAWRVVVTGMAEHSLFPHELDREGAAAVLAWDAGNSRALRIEAAALQAEGQDDKAEALLGQALGNNPTDGRALVALAALWAERGEAERADQAVDLATRLSPANWPLRTEAAAYWISRARLDRTVENWSAAIDRRPSLGAEFFPVFLRLAEAPDARWSIERLAQNPPIWWERFFNYATRSAAQLDTLRALYEARLNSDEPLTEMERERYVARLMREAQWSDAYLAWVSGLGSEDLRALGQVYDGGFERPFPSNGFAWRAPTVKGVRVETDRTFGVNGDRALHVVFVGKQVRFRHVSQPLQLGPGAYRLSGRVRPDSLKASKGLRWRVSCARSQLELGLSERFLGADRWRRFDMEFEVPEMDCDGQELRLEVAGKRITDFILDGGIWFDDLSIARLRPQA